MLQFLPQRLCLKFCSWRNLTVYIPIIIFELPFSSKYVCNLKRFEVSVGIIGDGFGLKRTRNFFFVLIYLTPSTYKCSHWENRNFKQHVSMMTLFGKFVFPLPTKRNFNLKQRQGLDRT